MQLRPRKKKSSVVINVTSLVDILFNLLLFFMVSTTFITTPAIKLELPTARHGVTTTEEPTVIYIDEGGAIYFNDKPADISLLGAELSKELAGASDKSVVLKADSRVSHGRVVEVMDVIKGAGATRLVVATETPK